jgi:hypothetical protein
LLLTGSGSGPANPDLFYISGFGLLPGLILLLDFSLRRMAVHESKLHFSYHSLLLKRLSGERKRTLMAVSFLAIGIFMVISTGLYRKDILPDKANPASGTGGYDYFVETTLPVLAEPNSPELKNDAGLPADVLITSFHVQPGDDASCLNLNRISRPRIIACNPSLFDQRAAFSFSARAEELDNHHPWLSLNKKLDDGVLPVFADQTVIQWSLGKKVGDTLIYKNEAGEPLRLKLIGGLENSIFQGNVIMAEDFFVKAFPSVSGANLFLIKSTTGSIDATEFRSEWRRYGAEITGTADRLQSFNQIENTYLNIFLMLGALGLLIGTIGLGILIFRITLEQIPEYAILQSVGFRKSDLFHLLLTEKLCLILAAVSIGTIPATLSAFPILLSSQNSSLWIWLPMVSLLVLISGLISIVFATRHALKNNLIYSLSGE